MMSQVDIPSSMQIPINPDMLPYSSQTYNSIPQGIVNKGHRIISISGPRNSSKTTWELLFLSYLHQNIADLVSVVCMLEYSNISKTFIPSIEEICEYGIDSPLNPWIFKGGKSRPERLEWSNGGTTWFLGLSDDGRKVRGLSADVVLVGQIEALETDAAFREIAGAQAGGRKGNLQNHGKDTFLFIGDCNPASKKHWWYRARNAEIDFWYDVKHTDHPLFWDPIHDCYTPKGLQTRRDLERLYPKGHWYDRMVDGLWVMAEGACYTEFKEDVHVVPMRRDDFGIETRWLIGIDFGNTTASGLYAYTDGTLRLFKEYYKLDPSPTRLIECFQYWESAYDIQEIDRMITDIETGNRSVLREAGYLPQVADKTVPVTEGIQIKQKALKDRKFFINTHSQDPDSPCEPDTLLEGKIRCLADEIPEIHYPPESEQNGTKADDKPHKSCIRHADDHSRYVCVDLWAKAFIDALESIFSVHSTPRSRW